MLGRSSPRSGFLATLLPPAQVVLAVAVVVAAVSVAGRRRRRGCGRSWAKLLFARSIYTPCRQWLLIPSDVFAARKMLVWMSGVAMV